MDTIPVHFNSFLRRVHSLSLHLCLSILQIEKQKEYQSGSRKRIVWTNVLCIPHHKAADSTSPNVTHCAAQREQLRNVFHVCVIVWERKREFFLLFSFFYAFLIEWNVHGLSVCLLHVFCRFCSLSRPLFVEFYLFISSNALLFSCIV